MTNDQYIAIHKLSKWYEKYQRQIIEISAIVGSGINEVISEFIEINNIDPREVMYLSLNQKEVHDLALKQFHAYYLDYAIYDFVKIYDLDSIPLMNKNATQIKFQYKKVLKNKLPSKYKMIIINDSTRLSIKTIQDIASFQLPIILIKDPILLPIEDSFTYYRESNINLHDITEENKNNPIIYFTHQVLHNKQLKLGNYDNLSIINKKQMNLFNLKSSDMNITISDDLANEVNQLYRNKILHKKDNINITNERVIVDNSLYNEILTNNDNNKVKVYLTKYLIGYLSKVNRHVSSTKYVTINFKPEFYHDEFNNIIMDRHYLNNINTPNKQIIPEESLKLKYAYSLSSPISRVSYWDKVTLIYDNIQDNELQRQLMYTAMTRAHKSLTILL